MKITSVTPYPVQVGRQHSLFVSIHTDEGLRGVGEAGLWGRELAVAECVRSAEAQMVGEDPSRVDHLWQKLFRGTFWRGGPVLGAAISAIDIALWDINAQALGAPVYKLLGGKSRERVRCYAHLGDVDRDTLVARAKAYVAEGWTVVRFAVLQDMATGVLEPGPAIRRCVGDMAAVREAVGEDVDIVIDFHVRLNPNYAIELGRALEPYHPFFLEDPIRAENPASYRLVRDHVSLPIATGEHLVGKWAFRELVEEDLINYARPDLCIFGGLTEAKKLAGWCETHYIDMAPHNPLGPVSTAACLALCTAVPNFGVLELSWRPGGMGEVIRGAPRLEAGHLIPSEAPGLGVALDEEACQAYPMERWELHHIRRADGAFTDW